MNNTAINWTDLTWNPASGCKKVSAGCKYCYAELLSENKRGTLAFPNGFDLTMRPWKLDEPGRLKTASLIFTNSMTGSELSLPCADPTRDLNFDLSPLWAVIYLPPLRTHGIVFLLTPSAPTHGRRKKTEHEISNL